ncbi:hypothetical protein BJY01DRAFT_262799 [Aspergillus pseudoustus]|uniref:Altered inheritance of mitochondria protein 9, mitochondrial n=1 Tax=Aspergillus pseudoustus TaxID=1810923 RepID=A0ABR4K721_9EURO
MTRKWAAIGLGEACPMLRRPLHVHTLLVQRFQQLWRATTASEAGALEYVRKYTSVPVPRVFTKLEAQLSDLRFPACGGLYLQYLDPVVYQPNLNFFSVGPWPGRSFDPDPTTGLLSRVSKKPSQPAFYQGSIQEQVQLLEFAIDVMQALDSHPLLVRFAQPTLRHTDPHMGNTFVANDKISQIVVLIDFQYLSVLPLFLQAQWPVSLKAPQDYTRGLQQPKLPDDFSQLYGESKSSALKKIAHDAMNISVVFRELFNKAQQFVNQCPDTDFEGWVAPQLDFEEKRRQTKELWSLYIERMAGEKSSDEARAA